MKIEINLPDPDFCNDCPCLRAGEYYYRNCCGLRYTLPDSRDACASPPFVVDRPKECIIRNGK